ncbi:hypothetical protein AGMMS50239_37310 [Bacteroidia bacterium]|nr:hypothetical protein AGMMS50239_37310 [Bacteroidia bacterium]
MLAQIRLSKQLSYDELHTQANYNTLVRQVMGVEREPGFEKILFPYQTLVDNVCLLDDATLKQINDVIVSFGHGAVFKKLRGRHSAIESNIHSLETRGLSRCPDRGKAHFKRYVARGVCACNLCCIGRKLQADFKAEELRLKKWVFWTDTI